MGSLSGGKKAPSNIKAHLRQARKVFLQCGITDVFSIGDLEVLDVIEEKFIEPQLAGSTMGPSTCRNHISSILLLGQYLQQKNINLARFGSDQLKRLENTRKLWNKVFSGEISQAAVHKFEEDQLQMTTPADWQAYQRSSIARWCTEILSGDRPVNIKQLKVRDLLFLRDHIVTCLSFTNACRPSALTGLTLTNYDQAKYWDQSNNYTVAIPEHKTSKTNFSAHICIPAELKSQMDRFADLWDEHLEMRGMEANTDSFFQSQFGLAMRSNNVCHIITKQMTYDQPKEGTSKKSASPKSRRKSKKSASPKKRKKKRFCSTGIRKMSTTTVSVKCARIYCYLCVVICALLFVHC